MHQYEIIKGIWRVVYYCHSKTKNESKIAEIFNGAGLALVGLTKGDPSFVFSS